MVPTCGSNEIPQKCIEHHAGPAVGFGTRQLRASFGLGLFLFERGEGNQQSVFSAGILQLVTGSSVRGSGLNQKLQTRGQSVLNAQRVKSCPRAPNEGSADCCYNPEGCRAGLTVITQRISSHLSMSGF